MNKARRNHLLNGILGIIVFLYSLYTLAMGALGACNVIMWVKAIGGFGELKIFPWIVMATFLLEIAYAYCMIMGGVWGIRGFFRAKSGTHYIVTGILQVCAQITAFLAIGLTLLYAGRSMMDALSLETICSIPVILLTFWLGVRLKNGSVQSEQNSEGKREWFPFIKELNRFVRFSGEE